MGNGTGEQRDEKDELGRHFPAIVAAGVPLYGI